MIDYLIKLNLLSSPSLVLQQARYSSFPKISTQLTSGIVLKHIKTRPNKKSKLFKELMVTKFILNPWKRLIFCVHLQNKSILSICLFGEKRNQEGYCGRYIRGTRSEAMATFQRRIDAD